MDAKTVVVILLKKCLKKILKLACFRGSFMFFIRLILCKNKILHGLDSVAFPEAFIAAVDKTQRLVWREAEQT